MNGEIVLVTGGSGFLGQHIVKELQERDSRVTEIRVLDLQPYNNRLGHEMKKPVVSYIADITDKESCRKIFSEVSCVFHCAALVNHEFPAPTSRLHTVNVVGTRHVVELCQEEGVPRLVFTSCSEVTLVPFCRPGFFSTVVNQTEAKLGVPADHSLLVFSKYASSKLQAEELVLLAHGSKLSTGGILRTTSLRPTLLYGEEDCGFIPLLMRIADSYERSFPRVSGPGGKHQVCYAGNAAWAHICAKDRLQDRPSDIGGLPVFITDDSPITDITKFCVILTQAPGQRSPYNHSWWYLPPFLAYLIALAAEPLLAASVSQPLPLAPTTAVNYLGSITLYNRLRAEICLQYEPLYTYVDVRAKVVKYYCQLSRTSCAEDAK